MKISTCLLVTVLLLSACGGGSDTPTYSIGGTVSGLGGSGLVLQNASGSTLAVASDGAFTFKDTVNDGTAYSVKVTAQPSNPTQNCTVGNASGTVAGSNVANVAVTCTTVYSVGGSISGLSGTGLVLQLNGGNDLAVSTNGAFTFAQYLAANSNYAITIKTQPSTPSQICSVNNGSGTLAAANVTSAVMSCQTLYKVGGTLQGLSLSRFSSGVVLQNNGGDDLTVTSNGTFSFATSILEGSTYNVTVKAQPTKPAESCTVTKASGAAGNGDVTSVTVNCSRTPGQFVMVANTIGTVNVYRAQGTPPFQTSEILTLPGGLDAITIDPSGQFAYIGSDLRYVAAYRLDPASGLFNSIAGSPVDDNNVPSALLVDPTGRFLYVANTYGGATSRGSVSVFSIDSQTGALTELSGSPYTVDHSPRALAIDPLGKVLYLPSYAATPGQIHVVAFAINQQTGALTQLAGSPFSAPGGNPRSIVVHPSGAYLYVRSDTLTPAVTSPSIVAFAVDKTTGGLTALPGSVVTGDLPLDMAISPSGMYLYATSGGVAANSGVWVYSVDPSTGNLVAISGSPFQDTGSLTAVTVDPSGRYLFVTSETGSSSFGSMYLYDIDPVTGAISNRQGPFAAGDYPSALAVH